jgi:hypothetical protein
LLSQGQILQTSGVQKLGGGSLFAQWDPTEVAQLARLLRRFADDALSFVRAEKSRSA